MNTSAVFAQVSSVKVSFEDSETELASRPGALRHRPPPFEYGRIAHRFGSTFFERETHFSLTRTTSAQSRDIRNSARVQARVTLRFPSGPSLPRAQRSGGWR